MQSKELQKTAVFRNTGMAAAYATMSHGEAMKTAAANSAGAMTGFMGLGMAQQAGGVDTAQLYQMAAQQESQKPAAASASSWKCACGVTATGKFCPECGSKKPEPKSTGWKCRCGAIATGKFCPECGAQKPEEGWICVCGAVNKGKFCGECGARKPAAAPLYRCDKCGWEPEDPKNPPRFCPECGDKFTDEDIH